MSLLENTNLSFFRKLANHNGRLLLPLLGLGMVLWVFEVSPVLGQDLQLGLPEMSGPVGQPIPQDSEEKDPQASPEKKVPPQAEPVQRAPAMAPQEMSPVPSQDLQLELPEKEGPVELPIPQDSREKGPQAIPGQKVPPQAEPVQKAPAMKPQKEPVDSVKQKPLPKKRPAKKVVKPSGPATWAWLPAPVRDRFAVAQKIPWRERADEVLIPRTQVRWPRYLGSLLHFPVWVDLGISFRVRYEEASNPFRTGQFGTDEQLALRTRARLGFSGKIFRFLAEFQDARAEFVDSGERVSSGTQNKNDIVQLFGSATFRNVLGTGFRTDLHVGRLTMDFGRRRLIARNRFRNSTNAFDGVHWYLDRGSAWHMRAFFVLPVARKLDGVSDFFGADDTLFWGVFYESKQIPWLRTNVYYFGINDRPSNPTSLRQHSTFGLRVSKGPKRGAFDYEGETAWQVGTVGTTGGKKDLFAHMHHAQIGYVFNIKTTPRLVIQYDYASGTRNPSGSQNETFDRLYGGRNWELAPTGIFGPFFRSNISSPGARIYFRPLTRFIGTVMVKYRAWWLAQARDAWVGSGLQDPTGGAGNFLGQDIELKATWRQSRNLLFSAGYDHFFKGSYLKNLAKIPGNPSAADSDYFYIQSEIRF